MSIYTEHLYTCYLYVKVNYDVTSQDKFERFIIKVQFDSKDILHYCESKEYEPLHSTLLECIQTFYPLLCDIESVNRLDDKMIDVQYLTEQPSIIVFGFSLEPSVYEQKQNVYKEEEKETEQYYEQLLQQHNHLPISSVVTRHPFSHILTSSH